MKFDLPMVIGILFLLFLIIVIFYNRFYKGKKYNQVKLLTGPTKFDDIL